MQTPKRCINKDNPCLFSSQKMLKLTDEQQEEFYELAGVLGAEEACAEFGEKHGIPSILLEAHLRRVKRLARHTPHSGLPSDRPPGSAVADEEKTKYYEECGDRALAALYKPRPKGMPVTSFTDLINVKSLNHFCKLYHKNPEAHCKRFMMKVMTPYLRDFVKEMVECIRMAIAEHARIHNDMPKKFHFVDGEFVERFFRMHGDPYRVSKEAAEALEGLPVNEKYSSKKNSGNRSVARFARVRKEPPKDDTAET